MQVSLSEILETLKPYGAKLVAVSKTHPPEMIMALYNAGQRCFGENRVKELEAKYEVLPADIEWHFIGPLQTNKVKYIASFVQLIHSVDSLKLLIEINKQAIKHQRVIDCLLEIKIAKEAAKQGFELEDAIATLADPVTPTLTNIRIRGLMGMATYTEDEIQITHEFRYLKKGFEKIKERFFADDPAFCEISMGMSGDYKIALQEGSTMVRIGSLLFGERL